MSRLRGRRVVETLGLGARASTADPHRLAQVLGNLLTNAAKYTPHGGAIHIAAHSRDSKIVIVVRDTGIGIDPKLLPHVFDLFVQGRQGIDRAAGGLGLAIREVTRVTVLP